MCLDRCYRNSIGSVLFWFAVLFYFIHFFFVFFVFEMFPVQRQRVGWTRINEYMHCPIFDSDLNERKRGEQHFHPGSYIHIFCPVRAATQNLFITSEPYSLDCPCLFSGVVPPPQQFPKCVCSLPIGKERRFYGATHHKTAHTTQPRTPTPRHPLATWIFFFFFRGSENVNTGYCELNRAVVWKTTTHHPLISHYLPFFSIIVCICHFYFISTLSLGSVFRLLTKANDFYRQVNIYIPNLMYF